MPTPMGIETNKNKVGLMKGKCGEKVVKEIVRVNGKSMSMARGERG